MNSLHLCPVCGFEGLHEPAYDSQGCASFDICPCCGIQFGYDDASVVHRALRAAWIAKGTQWVSRSRPRPAGWEPSEQLRRLRSTRP